MIYAGSASDQYFSSGSIWTPANDPTLSALPYQTLRYGPSFSYDIPVPNGMYVVALGFLEPNATRAGQRLFSVTVNGRTMAGIDLFHLAGLKVPFGAEFRVTVDSAQPSIKIALAGQVGNAVLSAIDAHRLAWEDL